jgi:serine/threonine-protein kinase RsbW
MGGGRTLRVPSDLGRLASVREFLRAAADEAGAGDACTADLVQAVDEVATNAIIHGHGDNPGWVEVDVATDGDRFIVTLQDDAPEFDPTAVPSPDLSVHPADRRPGGMGVLLARLCVDEMTYRPRPGGGNILTLVRRFERNGKEDR